MELRQEVVDNFSGDVGQAEVAALPAVGQAEVVDAQQVQHGGVQIVDVDHIFHRVVAQFVRRSRR